MSQDAGSQIVADFTGGVLRPLEPIDLPDQTRVNLTLKVHQEADEQTTVPQADAAWKAYKDHLLNGRKYRFAGLWNRDALYDRH
jgi:predicted DNA-binding antitoxin AbrB/MazE fold protein